MMPLRLDLGIEFLQTQDPTFMQQVEFMSQYNLMRPSDAKKRPEVQVSTGLDQKGGGRRGREEVERGAGRRWKGGQGEGGRGAGRDPMLT